ncbi:MAG: FtsQ-type POTRA domain-containing protein [Alphaproteobacteria bacterium]|nr:FtsQ-type POTRA domain-containing protein [Alphaproteobacteria bacterium]
MKIKIFSYSKIQATLVIVFSILIVSFCLVLSVKIFNFVKVIPVNNVVINGASPEVKQEIMKSLAFLRDEKVMSVDLENLRLYLNSMPWVYKSAVSRNLSGEIIITIMEINPYFLWLNDDNNYKLITSDDTQSQVKLNFPLEDLITIEKGSIALKNSHKLRFLIYQDLNILKEIKTLRYNGYRWDIILKNGLVIRLPEENMIKAYTTFLNLNKKYNFLDKNLDYIDATAINKLFIQVK